MRLKILIGILILLISPVIIYFIRYDFDTIGHSEFKHDRFDGVVYRRLIGRDDLEWKKTRYKNIKHARETVERNLRESALEDMQENINRELDRKLNELNIQQSDLEDELRELRHNHKP